MIRPSSPLTMLLSRHTRCLAVSHLRGRDTETVAQRAETMVGATDLKILAHQVFCEMQKVFRVNLTCLDPPLAAETLRDLRASRSHRRAAPTPPHMADASPCSAQAARTGSRLMTGSRQLRTPAASWPGGASKPPASAGRRTTCLACTISRTNPCQPSGGSRATTKPDWSGYFGGGPSWRSPRAQPPSRTPPAPLPSTADAF